MVVRNDRIAGGEPSGFRAKLGPMEDPEAYLRALTAPLASAREGSPLPVVRFSLEAVANAFVMLGLLPEARAEEILAAQRPVLEAAGFRVGLEIGELSLRDGAHGFQEARAASADSLRRIPLAVAAGPVRCRLRGHDLTITSATLTPEGISLRYHGVAREGDRRAGAAAGAGITEATTELSITDDTGVTYRVLPGNAHGVTSGRCLASGGVRWLPEGELLAVPAPGAAGSRGARPAVRWLELSGGSGQPVRMTILPPATVPTSTTQPPWPTPAECYLAELPPLTEWSKGSSETGTVELDAAAIRAAVTGALLAVGALPPDSALLTGPPDREPSGWQAPLAGQENSAGLAVRFPFNQATAVIENVTVHEDLVSVQLYGHPWITGDYFPMITPCFRVTAVDDTGMEHKGVRQGGSELPTHEGRNSFLFLPPLPPQAKQLRVIVSTLWEAAWALIDIPGR
jgi:hypothetical protein